MVLDILAAIGLKETGKYVAKDVLLPLLQGSLEDYAKDFFKGCIADTAGLASQAPVQKALAEALKAFVELIEAELEFQGCSGAEIRDFYEIPLREFMRDKDVKATLGQAFEPDCRTIEAEVLALRWQALDLRPLPEEFDWPQIGKQYVRAVKGILRSSDELRDLLKLHNQEAMRQGIEALVGIPTDFDLQKYQETLREQYGNLKLESLDTSAYAYNDLKLWRMFIPQDVRTCQEFNPKVYEIPKEKLKELQQRGELDAEALEAAQIEAYRQTYVEQPIQNVLEVVGRTAGMGQRSRPVVDYAVVLGDPGSGKSTLLQYVALQWAEQPVRDLKELAQRPLPLLIELRKYARDRHDKKCSSIVEYLDKGDIACRLNQQRLHEVLLAGDAVALFDGIDEVFDPNLRHVVVTDIHRFTNDYPQVQVVVTSRWLGYKAQTLRDAGFQHYMLQDLTDEQIAEFIARWHDQTFPEGADKVRKRERLHKAIRESKAIRELAGNPLLLTMMAILNRNQELPRDRPELYNQASRVLLHQWDVERNLIEQKLDPVTIDYRDKQAMLRKVAYHMQSGEAGLAGNIISAQDLETILTDFLKSIDIDKPREVARLMIRQLRERNFILCYLGADTYAFVHRTFLEFFAAWAFVWEFKETQTLSFEALLDQAFKVHWHDEDWHEVLRLISGMIDQTFSGRIIDFLLCQDGESSYTQNETRFANLFLAADCYYESRIASLNSDDAEKILKSLIALIPYSTISRNEETGTTTTDYGIGSKAVSYIGKLFHEEPDSFDYLKSLLASDSSDFTSLAVVNSITENYRDHPQALLWLKEVAETKEMRLNYRVAPLAVSAIARCWTNESDTLNWLKDIAQSTVWQSVSIMAVQEIGNIYNQNSEIKRWLKESIQSSSSKESLRSAAVQVLAERWKDDPDTLPILKRRAQVDQDNSVRRAAVQALAKGWEDDPSLFEFWCDRTLNDLFEREYDWQGNPRQIALNVLVQQYPDHPKTLELLRDRAQNDNDEQLREWAAKQLEKSKVQN
ncbi:NTPase [filamentous cyanobacterium CCT1]|nr:NTPase [filamentous cyanobacterium CCT1]PSN76305.1 NTPase [filamentous cyanobacterium CCP4]